MAAVSNQSADLFSTGNRFHATPRIHNPEILFYLNEPQM